MGAVFAIFAGFYYWFEKMSGIVIPRYHSVTHFYLFFFGANLTFFPMHFLGLAGMPRRISNYPESFIYWNWLCTLGSLISTYSLIYFLITLYYCASISVNKLCLNSKICLAQINFVLKRNINMTVLVPANIVICKGNSKKLRWFRKLKLTQNALIGHIALNRCYKKCFYFINHW
jgi:hypothetical protein